MSIWAIDHKFVRKQWEIIHHQHFIPNVPLNRWWYINILPIVKWLYNPREIQNIVYTKVRKELLLLYLSGIFHEFLSHFVIFSLVWLLVGGIFHVFLTCSVNILVLFFLSCLYEYIVDIIFSKILFSEWVIVVLRQVSIV